MARPKKIMTPGELRSAKAVLKQELKTYVATVKDAERAVKAAQADKAAAVKAAAKTLAEATKAHDAAVKAAVKTFEAVNKVQGKVIGRAFAAAEMPDVISKVIDVYRAQRLDGERFIETVRRIGLDPFKIGVYGDAAIIERKQNA